MFMMKLEMRTGLGRGATVRGATLGEVLDLGWAMIMQWRKQSRKYPTTNLVLEAKGQENVVNLKDLKRKDFDLWLREAFDFPRFKDGTFYVPERFR